MLKNSQGSSLLMVTFFTCIMSLMALGIWRNSMHVLEASLARVSYAQRIKSLEGLLQCGVELGIENYAQLMHRAQQEIMLECPAWFGQQGIEYKGAVYFKARQGYIEVRATLAQKDTIISAVRCHVRALPETKTYVLESWKME